MKTVFLILAGLCLPVFSAMAQDVQHATINTYSLNLSPAPAAQVPAAAQSASIATYVVILDDISAVAKVCVRISPNQQSNGSILDACYATGSQPITDGKGLTLFQRNGNAVIIKAVIADPQVNTNYEVCTEDSGGQKTSYLSKIK